MMPKLDGYSVCKTLKKNSDVPIIILTALENITNKIPGFELEADDYIMKPFSPKELEKRIKSALIKFRLSQNLTSSSISQIDSIIIDKKTKSVYKNNKKIKLTTMEFNLLNFLISKINTCLSRNFILEQVWSYTSKNSNDTRVVDVHISRLRKKLEDEPLNPKFILTLRGKGYLIKN